MENRIKHILLTVLPFAGLLLVPTAVSAQEDDRPLIEPDVRPQKVDEALIDTENFVRIGPFKEVMNWAEYAEFLTNWARSSSWDCSYQRLTEAAELVLLELEEFSEIGDFRSVVNTASVYEFSTENKIRYIAVYLQMQLPDPAMLPSFGTAEDTP